MTRGHRKSKLASFCAENIFRKSHGRNFGCWSRCLSKLQKCALGGVILPPLAVEGLTIICSILNFKPYEKIQPTNILPHLCLRMWFHSIAKYSCMCIRSHRRYIVHRSNTDCSHIRLHLSRKTCSTDYSTRVDT